MRYRDAKKLHNGDQVIRKEDQAVLIVKSVEVYGQYKLVRINCVDAANTAVCLTQAEVE